MLCFFILFYCCFGAPKSKQELSNSCESTMLGKWSQMPLFYKVVVRVGGENKMVGKLPIQLTRGISTPIISLPQAAKQALTLENSLPASILFPQFPIYSGLFSEGPFPHSPSPSPRYSLASDTTTVLFMVQIAIRHCSILPSLIHHSFVKVCRNAVCFVQGPTSDGHSFNEPLLNK